MIQEAESFVKIVLPKFSSHHLEFYEGKNMLVSVVGKCIVSDHMTCCNGQVASVGDSKYEVPSALLNPDNVHQMVACPAETPGTVSMSM